MDRDVKQQFINFLRKNKCYCKFVKNVGGEGANDKIVINYVTKYPCYSSWISANFSWAGTPEGHIFWNRLSSMWKNKFK